VASTRAVELIVVESCEPERVEPVPRIGTKRCSHRPATLRTLQRPASHPPEVTGHHASPAGHDHDRHRRDHGEQPLLPALRHPTRQPPSRPVQRGGEPPPARVTVASSIRTTNGSSRLVLDTGRDHRPCAQVRLGSIMTVRRGRPPVGHARDAGAEVTMRTLAALGLAALWILVACGDGSPPRDLTVTPQEHTVQLPEPALDGDVSVESALAQRRSIRDLRPDALTLDEVGQVLWAAQGITADWGGRTAPSAGATYPSSSTSRSPPSRASNPASTATDPTATASNAPSRTTSAPSSRRPPSASRRRSGAGQRRHRRGGSTDRRTLRAPSRALRHPRSRPRRPEHRPPGRGTRPRIGPDRRLRRRRGRAHPPAHPERTTPLHPPPRTPDSPRVRARKPPAPQGASVERTTGFEPATLTHGVPCCPAESPTPLVATVDWLGEASRAVTEVGQRLGEASHHSTGCWPSPSGGFSASAASARRSRSRPALVRGKRAWWQ
jgi:hypothetical protein